MDGVRQKHECIAMCLCKLTSIEQNNQFLGNESDGGDDGRAKAAVMHRYF